jgi:hypothetical protein
MKESSWCAAVVAVGWLPLGTNRAAARDLAMLHAALMLKDCDTNQPSSTGALKMDMICYNLI